MYFLFFRGFTFFGHFFVIFGSSTWVLSSNGSSSSYSKEYKYILKKQRKKVSYSFTSLSMARIAGVVSIASTAFSPEGGCKLYPLHET